MLPVLKVSLLIKIDSGIGASVPPKNESLLDVSYIGLL